MTGCTRRVVMGLGLALGMSMLGPGGEARAQVGCGPCDAQHENVVCRQECIQFRCEFTTFPFPRYAWMFDGPVAMGEPCGSYFKTECTFPDTCNGYGRCLPNDQPNGTLCGDPMETACDRLDVCLEGLCTPNWASDYMSCAEPDAPCRLDVCFRGGCFPLFEEEGTPCGEPGQECDSKGNCDWADGDHDGVADVDDNCPLVPNGPDLDDQADADGDGMGDACERGDVTCDGWVDQSDARAILRYGIGLLAKDDLHCEEPAPE